MTGSEQAIISTATSNRSSRSPLAPIGLAHGTKVLADEIPMHRPMVGAEPVDQRLHGQPNRSAANRVPTVDEDPLVGRKAGWRSSVIKAY